MGFRYLGFSYVDTFLYIFKNEIKLSAPKRRIHKLNMSESMVLTDSNGNLSALPFPVGMIMLWYGTAATVPAGWSICDGSGLTPNLINKFVRGGGSTSSLNSTGGDDSVSLTGDNLPPHTHTVTMGVGGNHPVPLSTNHFSVDYGTPKSTTEYTVKTSPVCNECKSTPFSILPSYRTLLYIMRTRN